MNILFAFELKGVREDQTADPVVKVIEFLLEVSS